MKHEHRLVKSAIPYYDVCIDCGSYHSTAQIDPKIIYEDQEYWSYDNKRSKIEEQVLNLQCIDDCGISKVDRILQFIPNGEIAIEIGCAPGVLLSKLSEKRYDVFGIEPSTRYIDFILSQAPKAKIIHGYFPEATKGLVDGIFDCVVSMDVMEHVDDYEGFFKEAFRLLKDGGTMVTMSPIILSDGLYRKIDFEHPDEHAWIFTQKFLEPYLKEIFSEVKFTRWIVGHELLILKK